MLKPEHFCIDATTPSTVTIYCKNVPPKVDESTVAWSVADGAEAFTENKYYNVAVQAPWIKAEAIGGVESGTIEITLC